MNNPFPSEKAYEEALKLQKKLDKNDLGRMYGVLVCDEGVLKAYSGNKKIDVDEDWVPLLIDFEKYKKNNFEMDKEIHELTQKIEMEIDGSIKSDLQNKREKIVSKSLDMYFDCYNIPSIDGRILKIKEIFDKTPPIGTGDCCAPKLLAEAFRRGWHIKGLAEFFYGKNNEEKECGTFYGPCDERCRPLLKAMLGLDIIYNDGEIAVVNKDSGLLSVPGKNEKDCVESRLKKIFIDIPIQCAVHRLDMDTSGLLVLAMNKDVHQKMNKIFSERKIEKKYLGLVDGIVKKEEGHIELSFRLDINNRPHQIFDPVNGKMGITNWKRIKVINKKTLIEFSPLTGRTHQLRLHCADKKGIGFPIVGDRLYGKKGGRLMLHASEIKFIHPITGLDMYFVSSPEWNLKKIN